MTITIDNLIENSFVISIDKARYGIFQDVFKNAGFGVQPRLIDGFKVNSCPLRHYGMPALRFPILGNNFTHGAIVKYGKTFDKDFVCIFEDDAFPCVDVLSKLQHYLTDIPDDCNLLKLGYSTIYKRCNPSVKAEKYVAGIKTWGCHSYIVFRKYYDEYFKIFEKNTLCDGAVFNDGSHIYATFENLFIQRNISGETINKNRNNGGVKSYVAEKISLSDNKDGRSGSKPGDKSAAQEQTRSDRRPASWFPL